MHSKIQLNMNETNQFDQIRRAILEYLDETMTKARNENLAKETGVVIQRALKRKGYENNQVNQELIYLVEKGYIKKESKTTTGYGASKLKLTTVKYYISSKGRDYLHGSSEEFKTSNYFGGINIQNIQGAIAIGQSNVAIVHKPHLNLYQALDDLKEAVLKEEKLPDEDKSEYVADIETIKNQVSKKNPSAVIVKTAWLGLSALSTIEGLIQFVERVQPLIEGFIK